MKIVICGGHHSSGLLVAKAFQQKGEEVFWFGHKFTMLGDKNPGAEYLEVTKQNIPFFEIKAGKLQRNYKFGPNLLRIPLGYWQSFIYLLKIRPNVIVAFGGYIALPVAISGWILGIPVFTHEQTVVSGFANKIIAKFAKKIFVSFKSSEKYFLKEKVVFSGLPIRKSIFENKKLLFKNSKKRTIYITGGKQGSHIINEAVFNILPKLLEKFNVVHQCGSTSLYNDIDKGLKIKKNLFRLAESGLAGEGDKESNFSDVTSEYRAPAVVGLRDSLSKFNENYIVKEYFFEDEIGGVFNSADFVVGRSGAHTVYELMVLGKPAILIPIPWSSGNEQENNAKLLVSLGLAKILPQEELIKGKLFDEIVQFDKNLSQYILKDETVVPKIDAVGVIISKIYEYLNLK